VTVMQDTLSNDEPDANGHAAETRHAGGRLAWP
jgi:hypothetical protein